MQIKNTYDNRSVLKKKNLEEEHEFGSQKSKNKIHKCAPAIVGQKQ